MSTNDGVLIISFANVANAFALDHGCFAGVVVKIDLGNNPLAVDPFGELSLKILEQPSVVKLSVRLVAGDILSIPKYIYAQKST